MATHGFYCFPSQWLLRYAKAYKKTLAHSESFEIPIRILHLRYTEFIYTINHLRKTDELNHLRKTEELERIATPLSDQLHASVSPCFGVWIFLGTFPKVRVE